MNSLNRKDISKLTAEKLNLDADMVDDLITTYYKQVSIKLSNLENLHINVPGLGRFSVGKRKLKQLIEKQEKIVLKLKYQVDISMSRYSTLQIAEERLRKLLLLQGKMENEENKKQEHREKRYE